MSSLLPKQILVSGISCRPKVRCDTVFPTDTTATNNIAALRSTSVVRSTEAPRRRGINTTIGKLSQLAHGSDGTGRARGTWTRRRDATHRTFFPMIFATMANSFYLPSVASGLSALRTIFNSRGLVATGYWKAD